jgi:hypothetical protein
MLLAAAGLSACNSGSGSAGTPVTAGPGGSTGGGGSTGSGVPGSATLSWQPPQTNTDGTALTNLAGYYIHYGTSISLDLQVKITTVGLTRYVIDNLAAGTWYFAVSSYNSAGVESAQSAIVSKAI